MAPENRRAFLRNTAAAAASLTSAGLISNTQAQQGHSPDAPPAAQYAYVGCYTTKEREGRGDGIHVYRMHPETGAWTHLQHAGDLVNPSFLVASRDQRFLYSVHGDEAYATSFAIDRKTGHLTLLNRAATGGSNGVHQAFDPTGRFMVVANYASGTVAVLPVRMDGTLQDFTQLVELKGQPGPNRTQQASSHPHNVVFDPSGKFVLVPDKGLDRVFIFRFDSTTGKLTPTEQGSAPARSGYAPRHMAFHPALPVAWVLDEIGTAVTTYQWNGERGELRAAQILPSVPPEFTGENTTAEIAVSGGGRFVYCSNRGHDSVAIFAADPRTGLLTSIGWQSTHGKRPRFIGLDLSRHFLFAANEISDTIVAFRANPANGRLMPAGPVVSNASPVTIAFVRA
ncbi:MAG TPA: lactonase family protein [Bryobacteraceae bacterium]|nr:lactonase family protein [Bryobacteraceae bacterium]